MNNYKKIILNNGIPLYLYSNKACKQVYVSYIIKYGSSGMWFDFEYDGKKCHVGPGYAHYLEHLLGERSKNGNIYMNFDSRCYDANAYTSMDHTCYHFQGIDNIKDGIKELIEAIDCPVFDKKDVNQTRHAICEEASSFQDKIDYKTYCLPQKNLFGGFELFDKTLSPIGDRKTTKEITIYKLYDCYNAFYSDDNKILVIAGNINEKEIVDFLNELYSKIKPHKSTLLLPQYDYDAIRRNYEEIRSKVNVDINGLSFKVKSREDLSNLDLKYCVSFAVDNLLDGETRFYKDVKEHNLLDRVSHLSDMWVNNYYLVSQTFLSSNPKEYVKVLMEKLREKNISYKEFELIRRSYIAEELRSLEDKYFSPSEFGSTMNYSEDYSNLEYFKNLSYERFLEILNMIDFDNYSLCRIKSLRR